MKTFNYTKPNGETSTRNLFVLNSPSDSYFGIDLSEFNEEERSQYNKMLEQLMDSVKTEIVNIGLEHNYRRFKEERMNDLD